MLKKVLDLEFFSPDMEEVARVTVKLPKKGTALFSDTDVKSIRRVVEKVLSEDGIEVFMAAHVV